MTLRGLINRTFISCICIMWIIIYHSYLRGLFVKYDYVCNSVCLIPNNSLTRIRNANMGLTGLWSTMQRTVIPGLLWKTTWDTGAEKISTRNYLREIHESLASYLTLALDHNWDHIQSPQGILDWKISCPPLLSLNPLFHLTWGHHRRNSIRGWVSGCLRISTVFMRAQTNICSHHTLRLQSTYASPFVWLPLRANEVGKITTLPLESYTQFGITLSSSPQCMKIKLFPAVPMCKIRV